MLTIWGRRSSLNVQKVMWLLGELGLAHRHVPAGGDHGGLDTPEFLAMNPHGRIPVLEDDGLLVWESHAILRYVAARYGAPRFWSADPAERSWADRWMDWAECTLQPSFLGGVFWGFYRTPEPRRDWPAIRRSVAESGEAFALLEQALHGRPYLGGEAPSLADIPAGALLYRWFELDIARPDLPNVRAWYARLGDRPAYREHVMIPFPELAGRLAP